jgi:universal stress protein E
MKSILAATDFSRHALRALQRAAHLAQRHRASLHLLHVPAQGRWAQGDGMFSDLFADGNAPALERVRAQLEKLADSLRVEHAIRVETHVVPGNPADEIAAFASAREVDLVVLASRGGSGLRLRSIGGTALRVLWISLLPVLLVRQRPDNDYRKLLVATDLGERAAVVEKTARALAPSAELTLMHAFRGELEAALSLLGKSVDELRLYRDKERLARSTRLEQHWKQIRGASRRRADLRLVHGHPVDAVLQTAAELDVGLIAIGKHSGPRWEEQLLGSVVQNLAQQARTDLLIVP